jgi:hypothetical protein
MKQKSMAASLQFVACIYRRIAFFASSPSASVAKKQKLRLRRGKPFYPRSCIFRLRLNKQEEQRIASQDEAKKAIRR